MIKETYKLFNSVLIKNDAENNRDYLEKKKKETISKGFLIDNSFYVLNKRDFINESLKYIYKSAVSDKKWNNAFYKSWNKLKTLSDFELARDQILHYFSTYGYEALGVYNEYVYYPESESEVPISFKLKRINVITEAELVDKIINLLSGVALKPETQKLLVDLISEFSKEIILKIADKNRNKEMAVVFADSFGIMPKDPVEFLRYLIFLSTDSTMIIKNAQVIGAIKEYNNALKVVEAIKNYRKEYGDDNLAKIFYRYKPLWLAFKGYNKEVSSFINKMRRRAKVVHEPMKEDYLSTITYKIKRDFPIYKQEFSREINKASIYRKVRLLNALNNLKFKDKVYLVRNGKSYAKEDWNIKEDWIKKADNISNVIRESIILSMKEKIGDKKVFIPKGINYALPVSEKNFLGNIPANSYITIDGAALVGVHWRNNNERVDLDLSLIDINGSKLGWNGSYRDGSAYYSGDVTDGADGASEFFYFREVRNGVYLINLNYYNCYNDIETEFDILVGRSSKDHITKNYIIDPNEVIVETKSTIGKKQKVIGLVSIVDGKAKFFFASSETVGSSVSSNNPFTGIYRSNFMNILENVESINDFLVYADIEVVDKEEDSDISLATLTTEEYINLF